MIKENAQIIINGCKALKNKHFYKEAFLELEKIKSEVTGNSFNDLVHFQAQCLYQDKEINSKVRFEKALVLLEESKDEQEKTRLKGAIFKRKYQLYKNQEDLQKAIDFYETAAANIEEDKGYGAANSIYLYYELITITTSKTLVRYYKKKIYSLRKKALGYLMNNNFTAQEMKWINPTIAELYFSYDTQDNYAKAKKHLIVEDEDDKNTLVLLQNVKDLDTKTYEAIEKALKIKTIFSRDKLITIEQLIRLYKVQHQKNVDMLFLEKFFDSFSNSKQGSNAITNIIFNILVGKIGLALSGGGFRASLFHIGVFSRLAELDMLKHVDVISSVSGGSIIAMHYYLKLQELLETKDNYTIQQSDYVKLVKEMQKEFLSGIQTNIRMQAFEKYNPCTETITQQIGKLYQKELFDRAVENLAPKQMRDLYIFPKIDDRKVDNFNPHFNNFEIENKVPILVINSTCLNNGHNWRFTASGMGESQYMYDTTIDKNKVHQYTRYSEFKDEFKNFTIADAVASSSCVPGLFDPIELNGAYAEGENIKLVDGGVYDNQGLASLIDEECNLIICSDASGQFNDDDKPSSCRLSVIPRVNDSLMDRGRDQAYEQVKELLNEKKIDGLCILHLKQCFEIKECTPKSCTLKASTDIECVTSDMYREYDVEIQDALSKIRTDLDSFNDIEAYFLMYSGYTIMSNWFEAIKQTQPVWNNFKTTKEEDWSFLKIKQIMDDDKERVLEQLKDSQKLFFKYNPFKTSKIYLGYLVIVGVSLFCLLLNNLQLVGALVILGVVTYTVKPNYLYKVLKYITKPILWVVAKFNLQCLNEKYLEGGKL